MTKQTINQEPRNLLAEKTTNWRIWYALFPMLGFVALAFVTIFVQQAQNPLLTMFSPILQLLFLAVFSFGLLRLFARKKITAADLGFDTKTLTKRNIVIILSVFVITHLSF